MSVIIPVFNCERYLWDTLASAFAQDLGTANVEIITVDDGSTDASLHILESLARRHSNMRVISGPNSGSAAAPRNAGLAVATGRYVFFLDADDTLEPDALRKLAVVADETGSGVVLCKMGSTGPGQRGVPIPKRAFVQSRFAEDFIDSKAYTTLGPMKLFRRSIIEDHHLRFPLGYRIGEDQPFTMAAYMNSPHISVLSDKNYYWLHGRADGTNATSIGQSAQKNLLKNVNLIRVIADGPERAERRDVLLERPVMGAGGLRTTFDRRFIDSLSSDEREQALQEVRELMGPLWTPGLRACGPLESQVLIDLVVRGDLNELKSASRTLSGQSPLPIDSDRKTSTFVYRPSHGSPLTGLAVGMTTYLDAAVTSLHDLTVTGSVGITGGHDTPDEIRLVWRHRRRGDEVTVSAQSGEPYNTDSGQRVELTAVTDLRLLKRRGEWDAYLEADWAATRLRERFGQEKKSTISTAPVLVGNPPTAALTFTSFRNLTVDVGPSQTYPADTPRAAPEVTGHVVAGRRRVIFIEGAVAGAVTAWVTSAKTQTPAEAELHILTPTSAAIILPKKLHLTATYKLTLIDNEKNHTSVADTTGLGQLRES